MSNHTKGEWNCQQTRGNNYHEYTLFVGTYHVAEIEFAEKKDVEANAYLIAAAPKLLAACGSFLKGWLHFCDCIDFGKSNLDADAIRFMNEVPGQIEQARKAAKS